MARLITDEPKMKLVFTILLSLLFSQCNNKTDTIPEISADAQNDSIHEVKPDTIVGAKVVPSELAGPDYVEKEYFVIIKNDTSAYSCFISKNKNNGKLSIDYRYTPDGKTPDSLSLGDSASVVEREPEKEISYSPTYKEQITEIRLIIENASNDFDLSKLSSVSMGMATINDFSLRITEQYIGRYGEKFNVSSNAKVVDLIEGSKLTVDINRILSPYSVIIDRTYVDGMFFIPHADPIFQKYKNEKSSIGFSKWILDGMVVFNITRNQQLVN